jgi:hypothetical protein
VDTLYKECELHRTRSNNGRNYKLQQAFNSKNLQDKNHEGIVAIGKNIILELVNSL